jgi:hypothetical protein
MNQSIIGIVSTIYLTGFQAQAPLMTNQAIFKDKKWASVTYLSPRLCYEKENSLNYTLSRSSENSRLFQSGAGSQILSPCVVMRFRRVKAR